MLVYTATPWQTQHVRFENFIKVFIGLLEIVLLALLPVWFHFLPQKREHADIDDVDKFLVLQWKLKHIKMAEKPHN